jgi:hypothetical protein
MKVLSLSRMLAESFKKFRKSMIKEGTVQWNQPRMTKSMDKLMDKLMEKMEKIMRNKDMILLIITDQEYYRTLD